MGNVRPTGQAALAGDTARLPQVMPFLFLPHILRSTRRLITSTGWLGLQRRCAWTWRANAARHLLHVPSSRLCQATVLNFKSCNRQVPGFWHAQYARESAT